MMDYIEKIQSQNVLFADRPSRLALQQIEIDESRLSKRPINVWRNHAFEPLISLAQPYLAYGNFLADFRLSDYDDTLMFVEHQAADIEILWIDSTRYIGLSDFKKWCDWFVGRIRALRNLSPAPIIVATWFKIPENGLHLDDALSGVPDTHVVDIETVCTEAGIKLEDARSTTLSGTPVGKNAQLLLARELACHWIPASTAPPIKVVAVDLDNTLHSGVLGEDAAEGVVLTENHSKLQGYIKKLQDRGVFIALVSRNEREDVEALFEKRRDYPLGWNDFSAIEVSWGDKAAALIRIAEKLRIAPNAILFVDDNPGELASVATQIPDIHMVHADPDAKLTQRAIDNFPGLWRWKIEADDTKRVNDMKANTQRTFLLEKSTDSSDYFRSLQVQLIFKYDPEHQLGRLSDLCKKTNQFNLALRRLNPSQLSAMFEDPQGCVVSVQMKDRLSDSGVIAVIVARRSGKQLMIDELCISCRALGRLLEDTMIMTAICGMPHFSDCNEVVFQVQHGERNQPAREWLYKLARDCEKLKQGLCSVSAGTIKDFVPPEGISLIKE